jgi:hypothetical protein
MSAFSFLSLVRELYPRMGLLALCNQRSLSSLRFLSEVCPSASSPHPHSSQPLWLSKRPTSFTTGLTLVSFLSLKDPKLLGSPETGKGCTTAEEAPKSQKEFLNDS